MQSYITDVLDRNGVDELADVRETLRSCFDDIHCFQLPRPGDQVVEDPSYDGSVTCIRQSFRLLLHRYMQSTFQVRLEGSNCVYPMNSAFVKAVIGPYTRCGCHPHQHPHQQHLEFGRQWLPVPNCHRLTHAHERGDGDVGRLGEYRKTW